MKTIEELDAEYAQKRAELEAQQKLAKCLPLVPSAVHNFKPCPWVIYKAETIDEVRAIAEAFPPAIYIDAREAGCLSIQPEGLHSKRDAEGKLRWSVPNAYCIEQSVGVGFFSACLSFWTKVQTDEGEQVIRVKIDAVFGKEFVPWKFRGAVYKMVVFGEETYEKGYPTYAVKPDGEAKYGGPESINPLSAWTGLDRALAAITEVKP